MAVKRWKDIKSKLPAERQARIADRARREALAMDLAELRRGVVGLTQVEVAELMDVTQGYLSQLERREDMLLSTLAEYVKALGGTLELCARFPDGRTVRITQFEGVKEQLLEAEAG
jgi:transcriptional regulator with XRE-family HTH domain